MLSFTLPPIDIPKIDLPFAIEPLMHPAVIHFVIALPIVILLLEIISYFVNVNRKAIHLTSLFFIFILVVASIGAYFTGITDGKEAFPLLGSEAKNHLGEHKLIGIYLMLFSMLLLILKLFSLMFLKSITKTIYGLALIAFIPAVLFQGHEGGELVYEYGVNVKQVKSLKEKVTELNEELKMLEEDEDDEEEEEVDTPTVTSTIAIKASSSTATDKEDTNSSN